MNKRKRVIMSAQDIDLAIQRIALQILEKNHGGESMAIVGIHTCGVYVARRIHALIEQQKGRAVPFGSLDINLYRDDWSLILGDAEPGQQRQQLVRGSHKRQKLGWQPKSRRR